MCALAKIDMFNLILFSVFLSVVSELLLNENLLVVHKKKALFYSQCPFMDERILSLHQKIKTQPVELPEQLVWLFVQVTK